VVERIRTGWQLVAALLVTTSVGAAEPESPASEPSVEDILKSTPREEDYTQARRCVRSSRIERTEILNDRLIVFHMKREENLLLQFPQRCPGLRRDVTLKYEKGGPNICEHDVVQALIDLGATLRWGPRCILPAFEPVTDAQVEYVKAELRNRPPADASPTEATVPSS
jgi:hypothetical protein